MDVTDDAKQPGTHQYLDSKQPSRTFDMCFHAFFCSSSQFLQPLEKKALIFSFFRCLTLVKILEKVDILHSHLFYGTYSYLLIKNIILFFQIIKSDSMIN